VGCLITLALVIFVTLLVTEAQPRTKMPRVGFLTTMHRANEPRLGRLEEFRQGLRDLGYVEGQNILLEVRYAEERLERLAELAAELVQLGVDVIVAGGSDTNLTAQQATSTIPIVMVIGADGYVASLARPGGNITGFANMDAELVGKRLELLHEAIPSMAHLAVLGQPHHRSWPEVASVTQALGLQLHAFKVQPPGDPEEFTSAFASALRAGADALLVLPSAVTNQHLSHIVSLAAKSHLPTMYALKEYVVAGGLMAYGASIPAMYRRAAHYVDKILKGATPADLPVERPMKFEFVINLKTAKAMGITLPPSLLLLADEVIQ
jgi:putative ABC transport system substrate-binding protein